MGGEVKQEKKEKKQNTGRAEWAATWQLWATLIGGGMQAARQAGKTRKCNSGRLSGYDISGSYSICSQTLKWRLAWHGGREVTTVSSLPVNPTTPSEENKIVLKRRRRGQETGKKIKQKKCIYILTME